MKTNILKLTAVFVLTLLFSAATLLAQDAPSAKVNKMKPQQSTPQEKASKRTAKLTEQLDLNNEQATAIYEIHLQHIKKMDDYRVTQPEEREQRLEGRKAIMEQTKAEIAAQLTSEQLKMLEELEVKRREKRQSRRGRR